MTRQHTTRLYPSHKAGVDHGMAIQPMDLRGLFAALVTSNRCLETCIRRLLRYKLSMMTKWPSEKDRSSDFYGVTSFGSFRRLDFAPFGFSHTFIFSYPSINHGREYEMSRN